MGTLLAGVGEGSRFTPRSGDIDSRSESTTLAQPTEQNGKLLHDFASFGCREELASMGHHGLIRPGNDGDAPDAALTITAREEVASSPGEREE